MQRRIGRIAGFSLSELVGVLLTTTLFLGIGYIVFLLFLPGKGKSEQVSCLSNMKQMGLAMVMYAEDYDHRFPPANSFYKTENGRVFRASWGMGYQIEKDGKSIRVEGLISPYLKKNDLFRCPTANRERPQPLFQTEQPLPQQETYMYNDLAATEKTDTFTNPANSILIAEGEDMERNAGHAWEKDLPPQQAAFDGRGKCRPERGATVRYAPLRHHGMANYAYADGHCKARRPEFIFFPPRTSADIVHGGDAPGPDPAGKMLYQGQHFEATFHLK